MFLKEAHQQRGCTEPFQIPQTPYPVFCAALCQPLCQLTGREQLYRTASHSAAFAFTALARIKRQKSRATCFHTARVPLATRAAKCQVANPVQLQAGILTPRAPQELSKN